MDNFKLVFNTIRTGALIERPTPNFEIALIRI